MSRDILVAEDDARIAELLLWFLRRRGYEARLATTFEGLRAELVRHPPALVICDVHLGALCAQHELPGLAREGLLPPTVVVSGYLELPVARQLGQVSQVVAVLRKPYELTALEALIRAQLAGPAPTGFGV